MIVQGAKLHKLGSSFSQDQMFITSLFSSEDKPVFEFSSFHVLSYLAFDHRVYGLRASFGQAVLLVDHFDAAKLFTPSVNDIDLFQDWLHQNRNVKQITNVSESWISKHGNFIQGETRVRSAHEAIYDVDTLNRLEGKDFANIRNSKNKLISGDILQFRDVSESNLPDAIAVLTKWQTVQGHKYEKNKYDKERFTYHQLLHLTKQTKNLLFQIGYINSDPVSVFALHKVEWKPNWGVIYLAKGINRASDGGTHGVTDATYCHIFDRANKQGLIYLNDGELGTEQGTRKHKLNFKPVNFLKSFDIYLSK